MSKKLAKTAAHDEVLNLYKRKSETPLQTIERYQAKHPSYKGDKMTYAGRLDPMAEGVLVVLVGEKNKERESYTGLDKEYEFEFMLGVETDTFDVLGKIEASTSALKITKSMVTKALAKYKGAFEQKYPPYSSKVVDGTPLYEIARQGRIKDIVLPTHEVEATALKLKGSREVSKADMRATVFDSIKAVQGDFRQEDILKLWDVYFERLSANSFTVYKAVVSCGSGFYVRQLVSDIGRDLGCGAVTVSILRTRVGEYKLKDSVK